MAKTCSIPSLHHDSYLTKTDPIFTLGGKKDGVKNLKEEW